MGSRVAGSDGLDDAKRLRFDPAMGPVVGGRAGVHMAGLFDPGEISGKV